MVKKILVFMVFALGLCVGQLYAQTASSMFSKQQSKAGKLLEKGVKALEKNKLSSAKGYFKKSIDSFDKFYQGYAYLAIIADIEKHPEESINLFEKSLVVFEDYKKHYLERKKDYLKDMERKSISAKIELDQHDVNYNSSGVNPAEATNKVNDLKQRVEELKKELEDDKNMKYDAFFRFKYGTLLLKLQKRPEAKVQFEAAIEADPEFKDTYFNMSVCYFELNDCANALKAYHKAKELGAQVHPGFEKALHQKCGK